MIAPEIAQQVIDRVFGGEAVRAICGKANTVDRPCSESAFYEFIGAPENSAYADIYARAIIVRTEIFAEDIIEIGDTVSEDPSAIAKAKLRTDTRKWLMAKLQPRKYGERSSLELTGKDGGPIESKVYDASLAGRAGAITELLDAARARATGTANSDTAQPS